MPRWLKIVLLAVVAGAAAYFAPWWLGPTVAFLGANADVIQAIEAVGQLLLWIVTGLGLVFGVREGARVATGGGNYTGRDWKIFAGRGGTAVGRDYRDNQILNIENLVIENSDEFARLARRVTGVNVEEATRRYWGFMTDRYRYIRLKGMGVTVRAGLKLPLVDVYVSLKGRPQLPEGQTGRAFKLAGREMEGGVGLHGSEPQPVLPLLQENDGLILLGDPGSGKTTFLLWLAFMSAIGREENTGLGKRVPFLLPLSAYAAALAEGDVRLVDFAADYIHQVLQVEFPPQVLETALKEGRGLFLLDGLDEVKDPDLRARLVGNLLNFYAAERGKGNKFVITSRIVGYEKVRPESVTGLVECTLADFEDEEIEEFVRRWTLALETQLKGESSAAAFDAEQERQGLLDSINGNDGVRGLAANPLLLTILALLKRDNVVLPDERVRLYDLYVTTLITTWNNVRSLNQTAKPGQVMPLANTTRLLAALALWMHEVDESGLGLIKEDLLQGKLCELLAAQGLEDPESEARQFLADVADTSGLLLARGPDEYGFIHLTFEEYLAAVGIFNDAQGKPEVFAEKLFPHVGEQTWREVFLLAIGYLGLRDLNEVAGKVMDLLIDQQPGPVGEAAALAGEAAIDLPIADLPMPTVKRTRATLAVTMTNPAATTAVRFRAGTALGRLGDRRKGVGVNEETGLPDIDWLEIPAGTFRMGSEEEDEQAWPDEKPMHEAQTPKFYIARFPVTYAQFAPFLEAGGYEQHAYWTGQGWAWRQGAEPDWAFIETHSNKDYIKHYKNWLGQRTPETRRQPYWWETEARRHPNRPVVGVTWYEALAYCNWLSAGLQGRADWMPASYRVQLPSEAEWEKAARGPKGWRWPWGDEWQADRANTEESNLKSSSPVAMFPDGASQYGPEEMAGNVWQWTRSKWGMKTREPDYKYPYDAQDGREDLNGHEARVLRGGSWLNFGRLARCADRDWNEPDYFDNNIGFRVVVSLAQDYP